MEYAILLSNGMDLQIKETMIENTIISDEKFGIKIYKTNLKENLSEILENELTNSTHEYFRWKPATVGYFETPRPDYRKCWDCKIGTPHISKMPKALEDVYVETANTLKVCIDDYTEHQDIHPMEYMEAINFVKYGVGEHFAPHNDHGFTYVCTVSTVTYFNDDYDGGELEFTKLGIKIKPESGDIVVFPSSFIYTHSSLPVKSGFKYAAVTMFDYTDKWHVFHAAKIPENLISKTDKTTPDMLCGGFDSM